MSVAQAVAPPQAPEPSLVAYAQEEQAEEEAAVQWVAMHVDSAIWNGSESDATRIARLPVGSYFLVLGDSVGGRIPVHYWGSTTTRATDGWVDAAAIGPIPAPGADWVQPIFPPRRVINDLGNELYRGDPSLPLVALTFDAGADRGASLQLLEVLRDKGVRATFFVTGQFADRYPDIMRVIAMDGHELANHSYTHSDFRKLSEGQMRSEIRLATASIESTSGVRIAPLWRAPFGSRTARILEIVEEEGLRPIYWTLDSGDWLPNATTDRVLSTVLGRTVSGSIVVHHVQPRATAEAMPRIIDELRGRGLELVTVSDLIGP